MKDFYKRIDALSPEQRKLFELRSKKVGLKTLKTQIFPIKAESNSYPLSFSQQQLWFLDHLEPGNSAYNEYAVIRLTGALEIFALEQSFNEIVRRHEVLRTTFPTVDRQPIQVINPTLTLTLPVVDLRELPESEQEVQVQRIAREEIQQPFNLRQGPLLRVKLLYLAQEKHILLLTIHHIVFDGWSLGVFFRELSLHYQAFSTGNPSILPELPLQYANFALWQRNYLRDETLKHLISYWKQQLASAPPVLELPTDYLRPAINSFRGARQPIVLPQILLKSLKELSQRTKNTLFITLVTAYKTLLYRYAQQKNIIVGVPIANRDQIEIEGLIGCFVNMLALHTDMGGDPKFLELLERVRKVVMEAYAHQELPFEKLVEEIQPDRNLNRNPLFQVLFSLQNNSNLSLNLPRLTLTPIEVDNGTAKFDLSLYLSESPEGLSGYFEYNTDLFDAATIARMTTHFQTLLSSIVANPDQCISTLSFLTNTESNQLLVEWNNTQTNYPKDKFIHELIEAQVESTPDAIAIVFEDHQLTYKELNHRANQLARYLQGVGVGLEVLVGICIERSIEMVVGLLGILKAGGAYVPLDPGNPKERINFTLMDSQMRVLLSQKKLVAGFFEHSIHVICLDTQWELISQEREDNLVSRVKPDNLAYVIYTSGSTGQPKGAMNTHCGIRNRLLWMQDAYRLTVSDCVLQKTSFSFDVSVWEFFWPLLVGACLVMAKPGGHQDNSYLVKLIAEQKITILHFVPSMLQVFLEEFGLENCNCLKHVFCSGEALPFELEERFLARLNSELHNLYGPTEAAIDVSFWQCVRDTCEKRKGESQKRTVPIGTPIANTQIYLLDSYLQPVPIGVPGELHIGSVALARGYLNRPELTAQKFIPNPFSQEEGARLYKTGDLACYLPDSNIEFLGRLDHQVKIRGFRIELGEIEAVLRQNPAVRENVVVAQSDQSGNKRLVAYVVSNERKILNISTLRRFVKEKLPEYMMPATFMILEAMPLTSSGKVNRHALPAATISRNSIEAGFVPPSTFAEEVLVAIWSEVLGVDEVGTHDNFFELGGDSILGLQTIARANQAGLHLTLQQLFQHQTITDLLVVADTSISVQVEQGLVTGLVPLIPIQQWFFEQNLPEPHHFNQSILLEVPSDLKLELWDFVVQQLLIHHDALRLQFLPSESGWQQFNAAPNKKSPFTVIDLSHLSSVKQKFALEHAAAELQGSLNLSEGSLIRVVLFHFGIDKPGRLLVVIHHLAVDGVSWRILLEDFSTAYEQISRGEVIKLPPKTTSFRDWAYRLIEYGESEALGAEMDYWLAQLSSDIASLPVDYPFTKEANTVASAASVSVALSVEQTCALLKEVPSAYNTQINDVLLAALVQSFALWTGKRCLIVDLEGHGREELFENINLSRSVGWFTTLFPVLLDLKEIFHLGEALKTIKEQLRRIPNRGIGYGVLRYLSRNPIKYAKLQSLPKAEVIFNYFGQLDQALLESPEWKLAKESTGLTSSPLGNRSHLLELNCLVVQSQLQIDWTYSKNIYRRDTVERLAQGFTEALKSLIAHCQSPEAGGCTPSDFPVARLSQKELDNFITKIKKNSGR